LIFYLVETQAKVLFLEGTNSGATYLGSVVFNAPVCATEFSEFEPALQTTTHRLSSVDTREGLELTQLRTSECYNLLCFSKIFYEIDFKNQNFLPKFLVTHIFFYIIKKKKEYFKKKNC